MRGSWRILLSFLIAFILSGCPKNQEIKPSRATYNTNVRSSQGTITLSDPKLYTRESLISERARDIRWLNKLILDSEDNSKVYFKPELIREFEQITSMSAAIGLKFDPVEAINFSRNKESSDIQHEIDVLKTQLQLDQLRKDAELLRAGLNDQTSSVNSDLGKLSAGGSNSINSSISASAVDQLKAAIDKLDTSLKSRLDATGQSPSTVNIPTSPFDDFRDRSAYRDMLKAAQNSAGLDELHDFSSSRLIRLNFQANVIPDQANLDSLGAIQIKVDEPNPNDEKTQKFLRDWLVYMNTNLNFRNLDRLNVKNPTIKKLLLSGSFEKVEVAGHELLLPVMLDSAGKQLWPSTIYNNSGWGDSDSKRKEKQEVAEKEYFESIEKFVAISKNVCLAGNQWEDWSALFPLSVQEAINREYSIFYIQLVDKVAHAINPNDEGVDSDEVNKILEDGRRLRNRASIYYGPESQCAKDYLANLRGPTNQSRWKSITEIEKVANKKVRIYEIGPREQVQQISTAARSASSLALAASIAANVPGQALGANAASGYSKQLMARASAVERLPAVVGFSHAGDGSFGWVIGPRATVDGAGGIDVVQLLKTYDLSVDMSVPGWWPVLNLDISTVWAPSPEEIANGNIVPQVEVITPNTDKSKPPVKKLEPAKPKSIAVPLARNSIDQFDALTDYLVGGGIQDVKISWVKGGPINACEPSNLMIVGDNIWRAKQVFVLGQSIGEDKITILADMSGILVTVPAISPLQKGNYSKELAVITPIKTSNFVNTEYIEEPSGDNCKVKKAAVDIFKDAAVVSDVKPTEFKVPSDLQLNVKGSNLDKVEKVTLAGQPGIIKQVKEGGVTSLIVSFDKAQTSSVRVSDNVELEFYQKDKTEKSSVVHIRYVRTNRVN